MISQIWETVMGTFRNKTSKHRQNKHGAKVQVAKWSY